MRITVGTASYVHVTQYRVSHIIRSYNDYCGNRLTCVCRRPTRFLSWPVRSITAERARRDGAGLKRVTVSGSQNITAVHASTCVAVSRLIIIITMATITIALTVTRCSDHVDFSRSYRRRRGKGCAPLSENKRKRYKPTEIESPWTHIIKIITCTCGRGTGS